MQTIPSGQQDSHAHASTGEVENAKETLYAFLKGLDVAPIQLKVLTSQTITYDRYLSQRQRRGLYNLQLKV